MAAIKEPALIAPAEFDGLRRLRWPWVAGALVVLGVALVVGAATGPVHLPPGTIVRSVLDRMPFVHVVSVRIPSLFGSTLFVYPIWIGHVSLDPSGVKWNFV